MKRVLTIVALTLVTAGAFAIAAGQPEAAQLDPVDQARQILEDSAQAYQRAAAVRDRMDLEVRMPVGKPQGMSVEFAFGQGSDSTVTFGEVTATAIGDQVFVTTTAVADKYLQTPLEADLEKTLDSVFGRSSNLPAPFAMRRGSGIDTYLSALGMGMLQDGRLTGYERIKDEQGADRHEVTITAENGTARAIIDPKTMLLERSELEAEASGGMTISATANYTPTVVKSANGVVAFDPGPRRAVKTIGELTPTPLAQGTVAPDFELTGLDGRSVKLSSLRGKVVVLDFWATWCGPCIRGLPHLQEFAKWAKQSGDPIAVYAIDTFEREPTPDAIRKKTEKFWTGRGFTMPTLLDLDSKVAESYGIRSIPMSFVIDREGRIAKIHRGYNANMAQMLRTDVGKLLPEG